MIPEIETQIGASLARIVADRGYRGHNAPPGHKFRVYISGQRRRVTETIKRELRRRSAVKPVIGHAKAEHRMGRNYLVGTHGDAANAVLAAAGYNFRRLLEWLALLLSAILAALKTAATPQASFKLARERSSRATRSRRPRSHVRAPSDTGTKQLTNQRFNIFERPARHMVGIHVTAVEPYLHRHIAVEADILQGLDEADIVHLSR